MASFILECENKSPMDILMILTSLRFPSNTSASETPVISLPPLTTTSPVPSNVSVSEVSVSTAFTKVLRFNETNDDIKRLQTILASDKTIYPEGITSGYFGNLTRSAIQRFQAKYGIVSGGSPETTGYGAFGPKTRAKVQEIFSSVSLVPGGETVSPAPTQTITTSSGVVAITRTLRAGISGNDVLNLQVFLNSDPDTRVASDGVGSSGNETTYFGSLTREAVRKFQAKYNIVSEGNENTTGYGLIGPKTRAKIAEISGQ